MVRTDVNRPGTLHGMSCEETCTSGFLVQAGSHHARITTSGLCHDSSIGGASNARNSTDAQRALQAEIDRRKTNQVDLDILDEIAKFMAQNNNKLPIGAKDKRKRRAKSVDWAKQHDMKVFLEEL